jgi:polysaccharide export outer membrane protein
MIKFYIPILLALILSSCAHRQNFIYLQGESQEFSQNSSYTPKLKKDDFLSILVFSNDENNSKLFNISSNQNSSNRGYSMGSPAQNGYLIDEKGEIDFPLIGKIKMEGISRNEASDLIKEKLKIYISNPIVQIQIQNFKITVLGEVKNPGTFTITKDPNTGKEKKHFNVSNQIVTHWLKE